MRRWTLGIMLALTVLFAKSIEVDAKIAEGVFIGSVDVSGMTYEEAASSVEAYFEDLNEKVFTLEAASALVEVTAKDFGIYWDNREVISDAVNLVKKGNIVQRYKQLEDLKHGNKQLELVINFDPTLMLEVLENKCQPYDIAAVDYSLNKTDEGFEIIEGQSGYALNIEESMRNLQEFLENEWNNEDTELLLVIDEVLPRGSREELETVRDILGSFTTNYSTSGKERTANVENGCRLINGKTLYPGDEFSTLEAITPFTEENGYQSAASYSNGLVVESLGGGICQVSTTLYNAVLLSELKTSSRSSHSMIVTYVQPSMDAAIAESSGKDFRFINNTEYPIYIEGITANRRITFNIYGVETRSENHKVVYESELLTTTEPDPDKIITDKNKPVGYFDISSAHKGYTAQLWKIVYENGEEISREVINKSTYKMSPKTAVVGISTNNSTYKEMINAALATSNMDYIKSVAAAIKANQELLGQ